MIVKSFLLHFEKKQNILLHVSILTHKKQKIFIWKKKILINIKIQILHKYKY